ncbi:Fe-hydrogenase maturase HydG [Candidatus Gastranaerophilus sp. (ex Termes propinquus)]|nr:Fe-hydrogenase maturase HydG [Candidatus Gastranaerophilus sp. (ex Termes propinquus)]
MGVRSKIMKNATKIINVEAINDLLAKKADKKRFEEIITRALEGKGLDFAESAMLLNTDEPERLEAMYSAAKKVKEKIYGNRIVLFCSFISFKSLCEQLPILRL